ncbi:adenylate kinase [Acidipropionibacterium virtanenii]|uniref:Adenylate kinase n=1 Tax=Acidipropionibacterium virtanenii TaxID=2057246 RepID=A0A344USA1_9ACTN|nr:adenylate kinase [Acidipropionibacterium virtanenii]AXE38149.1 Adenylate kinase [Acidipropionibacterium virtanenii]
MRLLIIGAPGAGKGTQATAIAEHYGIPAVSTGDIFRANINNGTELGRKVESIMDAGELVPDEVTDAIVVDRLGADDAADGFLLDGYPRNLSQVTALDTYLSSEGLALDAVVSLEVDPELLTARLLKRAEIEGRADDNEETIRNRMAVYTSQTAPLIDHYRQVGLLVPVDGVGEIAEVRDRIFAALDARA